MNFDFLKDGDPDDGTIRINTSSSRRKPPALRKQSGKPGAAYDTFCNVMGFFIFVALLGGCVSCMNVPKMTDAEWAAEDQSLAALWAAQRHIKPMLKSPASAKWPSVLGDDRALHGVARMADGTYVVTSFVDSQNGFGAMIRTPYRVHLRVRREGPAEILGSQILGPR